VEKECVWAWWYVSNKGYKLKGMRAKADSRGARQVIRGNSVVMLEVWFRSLRSSSLCCSQERKRLILAPQ
jgi:hypothetical protein